MAAKLVVVGPVNGRLRDAFTKIKKLHDKIDLSIALVVGDLFANDAGNTEDADLNSLLNGSLAVSVPTYFTVGNHSLPSRVIEKLESNDEVCPNLYFLGRKGLYKTSEGIRIAALGGKLIPVDSAARAAIGKYDPFYVPEDAKGLHGLNTADILITNEWPLGIRQGSNAPVPETFRDPSTSNRLISDLCSVLKPRYHFSHSHSDNSPDAYYEREPFFHPPKEDSVEVELVTRFYSLAPFGNSAKEKSLYAFTLDPTGPPPAAPNKTRSPFTPAVKRRRALDDQGDSYSRFRNGHDIDSYRPHKRANNGPRIDDPSKCFFCLGNDTTETHLISSIGSHAYLTVPKGPLSLPSTFPDLGIPAHIQIIPQAHASSPTSIPNHNGSTPQQAFAEMQLYRKSLCRFVQKKAHGKLGAVLWEVSRSQIRHFFQQFLPAPVDLIRKGLVEGAFKVAAENAQYHKFERCDPDHMTEASDGDYFRVWVWSPPLQHVDHVKDPIAAADAVSGNGHGGGGQGAGSDHDGVDLSILLRIGSNDRFDINFGRQVMAGLLGLEKRYNWRDCEQTNAEEVKDKDDFVTAFADFDFTTEEGYGE